MLRDLETSAFVSGLSLVVKAKFLQDGAVNETLPEMRPSLFICSFVDQGMCAHARVCAPIHSQVHAAAGGECWAPPLFLSTLFL